MLLSAKWVNKLPFTIFSMGLCSGGRIIGRIFACEIWGAYFWEGSFLRGLLPEKQGIVKIIVD